MNKADVKISWVILTYNRANSVLEAIPHCIENAGCDWNEIIWVDNGSEPMERERIEKMLSMVPAGMVTKCLIPKNLGVAKGYNTAMALCRGTHLVITGCDMLMPKDWLRLMRDTLVEVPNAGISTIYAAPIESTPERIRGPEWNYNGFYLREAMPIGRRLLSVELQREIGYFPESFGMYGWDDVAWGNRAEVVLRNRQLKCYNLYKCIAEHLGTEGNVGYDHKDEHEYWRWKKKEVDDPRKHQLLQDLQKQGWPRFSPY